MIIDINKHFKEYQEDGSNCWDLVVDIYKDNNIELPRSLKANSPMNRNNIKEFMIGNIQHKVLNKPIKGAILLLSGNPFHCGICLDNKTYIHRKEKVNTRIDRIENEKVKGIYLVK